MKDKIISYGMENSNNKGIRTIRCYSAGCRHEWRVVISWLLLLLVGALVVFIENGSLSIKWWIIFISICVIVFWHRFIYDLIKPEEIEFYDDNLIVFLCGFNIKRKWIIQYKDLLVTCIGYNKQKKKRRVVIGDTTKYWHSCSLDYPAGWKDDLQEEVLEQLRKVGGVNIKIKS